MVRIGGHFHSDDPLAEAVACDARTAQFFLGDPQGWKGPVIPGGDPAALRLTVVAILLSMAALVASETLARHLGRRLSGE